MRVCGALAAGQQVAHNVKTAAKRQQEVEQARLRQREWHWEQVPEPQPEPEEVCYKWTAKNWGLKYK